MTECDLHKGGGGYVVNKLDKGERFRGCTAHTLRLEWNTEWPYIHCTCVDIPWPNTCHVYVHVHANIHVHVRTSPLLGSNKSTKVPAPPVRRYSETRKSHVHAFATTLMFNYAHIVLFINTIENQVSSQWTRYPSKCMQVVQFVLPIQYRYMYMYMHVFIHVHVYWIGLGCPLDRGSPKWWDDTACTCTYLIHIHVHMHMYIIIQIHVHVSHTCLAYPL